MDRVSNSKQHRDSTQVSIGFIDGASMDITLTQEFRTREYTYLLERYTVNGKTVSYTEDQKERRTAFYVGYHLSGQVIISENLEYVDTTLISDSDIRYKNLFATTKIAYNPAPNLTLTLENKYSGYGRQQDVPVISSADTSTYYQYTWVKLNLTF
jgi:hypothetical protein